jgi:hypothetical protein
MEPAVLTVPVISFDRPLTWVVIFGCLIMSYASWTLLTTNWPWHQHFHVERGVNMAMKCKHCQRAMTNGWW